MPDAETFLRQICADPSDDSPRLVFADWLQEHGEEDRAEFIRVQIAIAELAGEETDRFNDDTDWKNCTGPSAGWCPVCGDCVCPHDGEGNYDSKNDPACPLHQPDSLHNCLSDMAWRKERLQRHERELLERHGRDWAETAMRPVFPDAIDICLDGAVLWGDESAGVHWEWQRGFIGSITLSCEQFVRAECAACNGSGTSARPVNPTQFRLFGEACPNCWDAAAKKSTGRNSRTPGLAGPLSAGPIERVTLSDKRPESHTPPGQGWPNFSWYCVGLESDAATLPPAIFQLLEGGHSGMDSQRAIYPTEAAAIDALSAACVLYGKTEAAKSVNQLTGATA